MLSREADLSQTENFGGEKNKSSELLAGSFPYVFKLEKKQMWYACIMMYRSIKRNNSILIFMDLFYRCCII
jgi:hypothetical protein